MTLSCCRQVIGVKDERMGEEVCACIKLKVGQECTAEDIKAFFKGKVSYIVPVLTHTANDEARRNKTSVHLKIFKLFLYFFINRFPTLRFHAMLPLFKVIL